MTTQSSCHVMLDNTFLFYYRTMKLSIIQNTNGASIVCDDLFHKHSVIILFTVVYGTTEKQPSHMPNGNTHAH